MENKITTLEKISFLIPVYHGVSDFLVLLHSIEDFTQYRSEILVSFDDPKDWDEIEEKKEKINFVPIINKKRKYFSKNINQLARKATGDYLIISNQDIFFQSVSTYFFITDCIMAKIPFASPLIMDKKGKLSSAGLRWNLKNRDWFQTNTKITLKEEKSSWPFLPRPILPMTFTLIERKLFLEMGGLDENIFFSFEDVDFSLRLLKKGITPKIYKLAKVFHKGGETTKNADKKDFILASQKAFWEKWTKEEVSNILLKNYYE